MVCRNDTFSNVSYESALDMHDTEDSSQGSELHGSMESRNTLEQRFVFEISTLHLHFINKRFTLSL